MIVQLIVLLLIILPGLQLKDNGSGRKTYIWICSMVLLLKAALRSVTIGSDTSHYAYYFYQSMNTPWSEVVENFFTRYSQLSGEEDAGYYLLQKVFSTVIPDFNVYTFFIQGLLFYLPLGILIYRYSMSNRQVMFAYVLFCSLFMGLPMANARQVYAVGFCIWAEMYLAQEKYIKTFLFIMLGYLIHASALLFFIPVLLSLANDKILKYASVVAFVLAFFVLVNANNVIVFMGNVIESERYAAYGMNETRGGALTYIVLSLAMSAFCMYAFWNRRNISRRERILYLMILPATFFVPLIYSNGSMIRITLYFQLYFILLMPYAIDTILKKESRLWYIILIVVLVMLSVTTAGEYRFFWEENQDPLINWT